MGVNEVGERKDILHQISVFSAADAKQQDKQVDDFRIPRATAPPVEEMGATARQSSVVARGLNSECSICLDNVSDVLYMNCGHVCTCITCCEKVNECPLCRATIVRRVKLSQAQV